MSTGPDLSDIDGTFEQMDRLLSVFQEKGSAATEADLQKAMQGTSVAPVQPVQPGPTGPDKSHFLKLDFPNGPQSALAPAPNTTVKVVTSPRTQQQLEGVGLAGKPMEFKQPIRGTWSNQGPFTTTPFQRPIDGPVAKPRNHLGMDMAAPGGTPIYSIADGVVSQVTYEADPSNLNTLGGTSLLIKHYDGKIVSYYGHLDNVMVRQGEQVTIDTQIGTCGRSGNARKSSTHLHLGVSINGQWVDPASFIGNAPSSQKFVHASRIHALVSLAARIESRGK